MMNLPLPKFLTTPAHAPFRSTPKISGDERLCVCFTGFDYSQRRHELKAIAEVRGLRVLTDVRKSVKLLVIGKNAGPTKLRVARDQGATIVNEAVFLHLAGEAEKGRAFDEVLGEYLAAPPAPEQLEFLEKNGAAAHGTWHECDRAIDDLRRSEWKRGPATSAQLGYLADLGVNAPEGLTAGDASTLIEQNGGRKLSE